jgi:aspartyl-tRNA(Asn)/glutamyl-tRNA(Gln) amidotransferase subunit A
MFTLRNIANSLRRGEKSSRDVIDGLMEEAARLDPALGVYTNVFDAEARAAADTADRELHSGYDRGPLHGVPLGVKDVVLTGEGPTTAQSLAWDSSIGQGRDAACIAQLRAAGAVVLGKTTTMEFCCGMPDPTKPFPLPRNPWDTSRWTGGSSSGSASGVSAGLFPAAIATDTGGSIRIPAAFCGVTGFKPSAGRVSTRGVIPLSATFDQVGPIARSVDDCAVLLSRLTNEDAVQDPDWPLHLAPGDRPLSGLRIGLDTACGWTDTSTPHVGASMEAAVQTLTHLGASVLPLAVPGYRDALAAFQLIRSADAFHFHHDRLASRWDDYSLGARSLLIRGAFVTSKDYLMARAVREACMRRAEQLFETVDVVISPTVGQPAPSYDEMGADAAALDEVMSAVYTTYWSVVGLPALALPMGAHPDGMPASLHMAGGPGRDATVLRVGQLFQLATPHHERYPFPRGHVPPRPSGPRPSQRGCGGRLDEVLEELGIALGPTDYGMVQHSFDVIVRQRGALDRVELPISWL